MPKLTEEEKAERTWLFKKGVSGNPKGRPKKGKTFVDIYNTELERIQSEVSERKSDGSTARRTIDGKTALCLAMIRLALKSDDEHIQLMAIDKIQDRIDGKALQSVQMEATVENNSVYDDIDVSKLNSEEKKNLENILSKVFS